MADLLRQLKDAVEDIAGKKNYAKTQMQKYKKVVDGIGEQLGRLEELEEVIRQMAVDYDYMELNSFSASGQLRDTYEDREAQNRLAVETIEKQYAANAARVRDRLSEAQSQYDYWSSEAEREEQEERIYEQQYYDQLEKQRRQQEEYRRKRQEMQQSRGTGRLR